MLNRREFIKLGAFRAAGQVVGNTAIADSSAVTIRGAQEITGVKAFTASQLIPVFNVTAYGAKGDGVTNDTAAIQSAIDAANAVSGGTVYFPAGIYIVAPLSQLLPAIKIYSNIALVGEGWTSCIKVANNAGNYRALIQPITPSAFVENVRISGLRFHDNPTGNLTADIRTGDASGLMVVFFSNFNGVYIEDCFFDPCIGVNTISLNGQYGRQAFVRGNRFRFVKGRTTDASGEYDNTAVYFDCLQHEATGNFFEASLTDHARGAIESHKGASVISNNLSVGYETICNVVSASSYYQEVAGNNISVTGNTAVSAGQGIVLYSINGRTLRNVLVSDNVISINNADRASNIVSTDRVYVGIGLTDSYTGEFDNIKISDNVITLQSEERSAANLPYCGGIRILGNGSIKNVVISGNMIKNSPSYGVRAQSKAGKCINVSVEGNTIVDAGNNSMAPAEYRAAILWSGTAISCKNENNTILDTNAYAPNGRYGIYANTSSSSQIVSRNNTIRAFSASGSLSNRYSPGVTEALYAATAIKGSYVANAGLYERFDLTLTSSTPSFALGSSNFHAKYQRIKISIINASGGQGPRIKWSGFKMASWTNPPNGYHKIIEFEWDGVAAKEVWRSLNIPN